MTLQVCRAVLAVVEPRVTPRLPPMVATLDDDEKETINEYLNELESQVGKAGEALGWFQPGSDVPAKLGGLLIADEAAFIEIATAFIARLSESMRAATNPAAGLLVIATARPLAAAAESVIAILKLDPKYNGARLMQEAKRNARIRIQRLKDLLPRPGDLQKGLFWPDPRADSDVAIRDRNREGAARYFSNAFQVLLSAKAKDLEMALFAEINRVPDEPGREQLRHEVAAMGTAPAPAIIARLKELRPDFEPSDPALTSDRNRGVVRGSQFNAMPLEINADGVKITIPQDKVSQVRTRRSGGAWQVIVTSATRPTFPDGSPADLPGSPTRNDQ